MKRFESEVKPDNSLLPPTAPVKVITPPEFVPADTESDLAVPSLSTVLSKKILSLEVPAVSVLLPPDSITGPLYLWSLVVAISFDKFIVWVFPDFPMVRSVNVPVIFVGDIADEKSLPADSIVKLPLPVIPDVAARYAVGSSLTILSVPAFTAVEPVNVLLPLIVNIPF